VNENATFFVELFMALRMILDIYVAYLRVGFVGDLGYLRSGDSALFAYFRQDKPFDTQIAKYLCCLLVLQRKIVRDPTIRFGQLNPPRLVHIAPSVPFKTDLPTTGRTSLLNDVKSVQIHLHYPDLNDFGLHPRWWGRIPTCPFQIEVESIYKEIGQSYLYFSQM
jgi:hypothetical protein